MNIINETPFPFAPLTGKVVYPKDTITLIIKGTFDLKQDGPAQAAADDEQLPPTGDLCYDDDPGSSVRYESDFAHFKPRADVLVVGSCHVPGGQFAEACTASFRAGDIAKTLMVFGDRSWQRTIVGTRSRSDPDPFTSMALRYENSFGGPGYKRNPVGKGYGAKGTEQGHLDDDLPNLKVLEGEQLETMQEGIPAGFGPLGRSWAQRMKRTGSYGAKWKKERWPWVPEDFDWSYYNAAPPDQQAKGYLHGDEALYFKNMHPEVSEWHTALPGVRVRCFLSEQLDGVNRFREVKAQLDTLWVDMDEAKLVLVWRGLATVQSPDCKQIKDVLIVQEPLADTPLAPAHYEQLLQQRKEAAAAVFTEDESEPESEMHTADDEPVAEDTAAAEAALAAEIQADMAKLHKALDDSHFDPAVVAELKTEKDPGRLLEKLAQEMGVTPVSESRFKAEARRKEKAQLALHRPEIEKLMKQHDMDPGLLDAYEKLLDEEAPEAPDLPTAEDFAAAAASEAGAGDLDMSGADFSCMSLAKANFKGAALEGASFASACLAGADFSDASLAGTNFEGADLTDAIFTSADVSEGRFHCAALKNTAFTAADLSRADMRGVDLAGAEFSGVQAGQADLTDASLEGANLEQVDFSGAILRQARLAGARISMAVFDGADLTEANCGGVSGAFASFNKCILTQADFSDAALEDCNYSGSRCDFTDFSSARLIRATLEGAVGRQVNFRQAVLDQARAGEGVRLPESVFRRAKGSRGNWAGADLRNCDFILAEMPASDFSQSDMTGCDCRTAELKQAVFDRACLRQGRFNRANLFQCRMEQADLTGVNFKGCNLFGAEFLNATIDDKTKFKEANLKGTKLADLKA